jgi:two-component system nitrogen regulation sensor histidine kinase GlnL
MGLALREVHMASRDTRASDPLKTVFENLTTAVLAFDHGLQLTAINPAGEMLLKAGRRYVIGKGLDELLLRGRHLERMLSQTFRRLEPFTLRGTRLQLADGEEIRVDCTVTPLIEGERATGLLVELNRVDRMLRLTREENAADRHLANQAVLRGLAHEIKNPLGGLRGAAQLLERELSNANQREYTRIIIHEADRLRKLVDRMMGPNRPLKKEPVNIHDILQHVRKLLIVENPVGLTVRPDYDPSLPDFPGDREQMIQAILNIARNAVEAMDARGTIILRTRIGRQFTIGQKLHRLVLHVDIEDNGPGIPEDLLDYIFYPMITGRPEGTGLGLAIAQDIINKHGGLVEATSQPGKTIISVFIPMENGNG